MADNITVSPQITLGGKITAGILLVLFTVFAITIIMAFWPDQLPNATQNCTLYRYRWFAMTLAPQACTAPANMPTIHLNTILLLLVAAGGFLGNMIHIATSFTTFVGAGKFQQSWILWYWVRPFTAAALALTLYFAFGATKDPASVDLDRILTLSILSGLFTDIATQKLKEVFDVLFSPKDARPNKLNDPAITITDITPAELSRDGENHLTITGEKLNSKPVIIKIGDQLITGTQIAAETIRFSYTLPETDKDKTELPLLITDQEGNTIIHKKVLPISENTAPPPPDGTEDAEEKAVG